MCVCVCVCPNLESILAVVAEIVLVGGAEYYRIINGLVCNIFLTKGKVIIYSNDLS